MHHPTHHPEQHPIVAIRALAPGEDAVVQAVFDGMSADARLQRFHVAMPHLSAAFRRALARVEPGQRYVGVALAGGEPIGLAQWIRDPTRPGRADVSVAVVDAHQRRGVGRRLLRHLAGDAARHGVEEFTAWVRLDNRHVLATLARLGARPGPVDPEERLVPVRSLLGPEAPDPGPGNVEAPPAGVVVPFPRGVRRPRTAARRRLGARPHSARCPGP
jgi:GNAT superfamily N-acetyltransferase